MSSTFFCRTIRFEARHHYALPGNSIADNEARFGAAAHPHLHQWALTVWLTGPIDAETGMLCDLPAVDAALARVVAPFDGGHINGADPFFETHQPTTEVLAGYFAERSIPLLAPATLARLRIAEMPDLFAEWIP